MAWQGIPFVFNTHNQELALSISTIPKLLIETPFSWETVISAFIAGALPSIIAIYALRSNYKIVGLQNKLLETKDFKEKFRVAVAEHVSDVILLASAFKQWRANGHKDLEKTALGWVPEEIVEFMNLAEKSKNHLIILIDPEKGEYLIDLLADIQDKLQEYVVDDEVEGENGKNYFNDSINNFIFESHRYLKTF